MSRQKRISVKKLGLLLLSVILAVFLIKSIVTYINAASGSVSEEQAAKFLQSYGWTIEKSTAVSEEITIPSTFSEVYERYNAIQLKQGYDLTKYKGERVIKYTFVITDFEGYENVAAHVLTWGGKIIGGDICSTELNGFMCGFEGL